MLDGTELMAQDLRKINDFPDLVRYLEDELDWPLRDYGFDELTFEFTPGELGLKEEDSARIKSIHQLRPLASGQPWGIFFVEFENKKLPVVVLRRILSHLAIKKRASANKASSPVWHEDDLLFITAFGEDGTDAREIAIAHFHQNQGEIPTLHVLGWDGGDTPLKLANVDHVLRERLHWPEDVSDHKAWRETWSQPFRHRIGHVITTASLLAEELASLARGIRDKAELLLQAESEKGEITKLFKAFQTALIHDLTPESFADTYAQTITYGLLTAAISRTDKNEGRYGTFVKADDIADMVPITNPFLKEMLQTFLKAGGRKGGIDFDELGIQDVVELLRGNETDLPAILRDFGNKTSGEDPVIHFYEHFLSAYNKQLKIQRGVFYTPQSVVSYIVRSAHELLQTQFDLADGLADITTWGEMLKKNPDLMLPPLTDASDEKRTISPDEPFVQILDPATGTATFLVEVIEVIHCTLRSKWRQQNLTEVQQLFAWNDYVPKHLLPRLHAYELMMAPYAIAHMKIGLKLAETKYHFASEERVRIYLANALEPWQKQPNLPDFEALAHEAVAVNEVKRMKRFTVIIGNPPYAGFSSNMNDWIDGLLRGRLSDKRKTYSYYEINGELLQEKKLWLQDDYVKFTRLSHWLLELSGVGVHGFITNNSFLDGPTHRGMRFQLQRFFSSIQVINLHGSTKRHQDNLTSIRDENVFDIQQGVAISLGVRTSVTKTKHEVLSLDLKGGRSSKYTRLESGNLGQAANLTPTKPWYLFIPSATVDTAEYMEQMSIKDVFRTKSTSVQTSRDDYVVDFNKTSLIERIEVLGDKSIPDIEIRTRFNLKDGRNWSLSDARKDISNSHEWKLSVVPYLYRVFDTRYLCYRNSLVNWPRHEVMDHLGQSNIALLLPRQLAGQEYRHVFVTRIICDMCVVSTATKEAVQTHPLFLTEASDMFGKRTESNFTEAFMTSVTSRLGLSWSSSEESVLLSTIGPTSCFYYIYSVLNSPAYRARYAESLKMDFPRLPLTSNLDLFRVLARLGGELVALHLLEAPKVNDFTTHFHGKADNSIYKPIYKDGAVWINANQRFEGVPEAVWNFHIGGYQVCEKWLKDRKGRTLSTDDIDHYQKIVVSLSETIRLMAEIDKVIEQHGGWPGAF